MGVCFKQKHRKNERMIISSQINPISNERMIPNSEIKEIDMDLYKVIPSMCKIRTGDSVGSGFFIRVKYNLKELYCLMTNEHVITREMVFRKETILISYDCEREDLIIKLDKSKRFIEDFKSINIDITIVEILPKDKIDKSLFLLAEINNNEYLNNANIYIPQFPSGNKLSYSDGSIIRINGYTLTHSASTQPGSSGSPIFLKNSTKVIAIHKQGNDLIDENYGDLIYPVLQKLNSDITNNRFTFIGNDKNMHPVYDQQSEPKSSSFKRYDKDEHPSYDDSSKSSSFKIYDKDGHPFYDDSSKSSSS
jgi:V8-like Glu-specific endopeptidase